MSPVRLYSGYAVVVVLSIALAVGSGHYWIAGLPVLLWVGMQAAVDVRPFFWLLLVMIPLGTEIELPGGIGTDLPTEPIAVGLTGWLLLHAARHWPAYDHRTFLHPIALLLYLHVAWILVASGFGELKVISLKFSLAKLWYVGAFFLLPLLLLRTPRAVTIFAHCVFWPLLFVAVQTLVRHAGYGFSFADQFRTMSPFMRNHVSYAGCLATFTPWLGYFIWSRRHRGKSYRWMLYLIVPIWSATIFFSYTRAAYVALLLAAAAYALIRYRLLRPAVTLAFVAAAGVAVYFVQDNQYLEYAPNYDTTIAHQEFDNLISATYKLEDISTMERFYRWVAGGNMVPYRPVTGFGPGSFVELYEGYTNNNFQTYVSDNQDRSGIHNYFLMTLVEQGYPGLFLLVAFLFSIFYFGQSLYLQQDDPAARAAVVASLLSVTVVAAFSIINDLLETDKVGSLFFISTAILISMGTYSPAKSEPTSGIPPPRY
ncbi:O-antigen ligase family protein [Neolewinella litorea]|uniref:O-antigen ligase family protein n=1 Tax=Neolewinella litorea TaxID=2562452 RepID=A0A4S4NJ86_9BACT|nr:O-antigen ligase family protein [Neolewinella litorea]THH39854.1 O-antigen ligase family protein [Neolewinella litorea]